MPYTRAHPRVGGENAALDEEGAGVEGSSPRRRGKLLYDSKRRGEPRLIPA